MHVDLSRYSCSAVPLQMMDMRPTGWLSLPPVEIRVQRSSSESSRNTV
jgi:hypothetical protein